MNIEMRNKQADNQSGVRASIVYGNMLDQMRYIEVLDHVKDQDVLDIACGIGWGSFLIAKAGAKSVRGVDISELALRSAQQFYYHKNLSYTFGSALNIPLDDNSFDVIVSFETVEHVEDTGKYFDELFRVGRPKAKLFLSTPNGYCFKQGPNHKSQNPFHYNEYSKIEVENILSSKWRLIKYKGQYPIKKDSKEVTVYRQWIRDYYPALFINLAQRKKWLQNQYSHY